MVGVVKPYVAEVLGGGDWFDEVLLANGPTRSQGVLSTAWALRQRKIDLAVLFQAFHGVFGHHLLNDIVHPGFGGSWTLDRDKLAIDSKDNGRPDFEVDVGSPALDGKLQDAMEDFHGRKLHLTGLY